MLGESMLVSAIWNASENKIDWWVDRGMEMFTGKW